MILKLGMKHQAMELYKVCINRDPFLRQGQVRSLMHLNGEKSENVILARNEQMDRRFMFMKIFWAHGVICPCPRAIYMYMTNIFKHLLL